MVLHAIKSLDQGLKFQKMKVTLFSEASSKSEQSNKTCFENFLARNENYD